MSAHQTVVELVAWGLDESPFRPTDPRPSAAPPATAVLPATSAPCLQQWQDDLEPVLSRADLAAEFQGLNWSLGIVDLRCLIAFQRRLVLSGSPAPQVPAATDRQALTAFAFPPPRPVTYLRVDAETIVSGNPDLTLRPCADGMTLYGGSPFLEVANFAGRALLRDGYHRAYHLLRAGVSIVPAVVIEARSLAETGACQPWFFPEEVLLSARPPLLTDFHDASLTLTYTRPPLRKTIRIHVEESFSFEA